MKSRACKLCIWSDVCDGTEMCSDFYNENCQDGIDIESNRDEFVAQWYSYLSDRGESFDD